VVKTPHVSGFAIRNDEPAGLDTAEFHGCGAVVGPAFLYAVEEPSGLFCGRDGGLAERAHRQRKRRREERAD
jgi:hypothetical protein